jgi:two-component system chemotaxis response regulator CheY
MTEGTGPSVVVADDHSTFRRQACAVLSAHGWTVLGQAESGQQALNLVRSLSPDVVVLDVMLGDMDGFEVAALLFEERIRSLVVLISAYEAATFATRLSRSMAEGAVAGFVPKSEFSTKALLVALEER